MDLESVELEEDDEAEMDEEGPADAYQPLDVHDGFPPARPETWVVLLNARWHEGAPRRRQEAKAKGCSRPEPRSRTLSNVLQNALDHWDLAWLAPNLSKLDLSGYFPTIAVLRNHLPRWRDRRFTRANVWVTQRIAYSSIVITANPRFRTERDGVRIVPICDDGGILPAACTLCSFENITWLLTCMHTRI